MKKEEFSQLLVSNREEAGCSKNEMCRRIGLLFHQLQRIENASNNYAITHVFSYLAAINCCICITNKEHEECYKIQSKEEFSSVFINIRKKMNLSQRKIEALLNVSHGVILGIETFNKNTTIDKFLQCIYGLGYQIKIEKL